MRQIILAICVLLVFTMAGCGPAAVLAPLTPGPSTRSLSPPPTPIESQRRPSATLSDPAAAAVTSGIHLTATIGPTCPGPERPGQVCMQPYQGLFVVTDNTGAEVGRAATDQNGRATFDLPPGAYSLAPRIEGRFPLGGFITVTVSPGQYVEVSVELDSGMR